MAPFFYENARNSRFSTLARILHIEGSTHAKGEFKMIIISKKSMATALLATSMLTGVASAAEISGNVGATTDYIWRGQTQSFGDASLSGGLDIDFGNGFAAGTWIGSLGGNRDADDDSANYEADLYASYATEVSGVGVELGYISYMYPGAADSTLDFADIYVSASYGSASYGSASLSYYILASAEDDAVDAEEGTYVSVDYEYALNDELTVSLHYGVEDFEVGDSDEDTSISLSKGDMTFTVSSDEGDDTRAIISWGQSF
jgi:uncharacterized protein (TIGR02001 family)